jgi:predicted nucleotidyltransferase
MHGRYKMNFINHENTALAEAEAVLRYLCAKIQENFAERLRGIYLYGSLVSGDFEPGRSDIDLLAVVSAEVTEAEVAALRLLHERLVEEFPAWDNHIEVNYLAAEALQTFRSQSSTMARISPGEPLHLIRAGREYLLNWYMVRTSGMALLGPPPAEIIPEIETAEFITVVREHAASWQEDIADTLHPGGQAYAVLTLCRALYTVTTGKQVSKKQAAQVALLWLPEWGELIEWAVDWWYVGGEQTPEESHLQEVVGFVKSVGARIQAHPHTDLKTVD